MVGFPSGRSWRTFGLALVLLSNCPPGSPGWPGSLPASPFLLALALPCRPCPPRERKRKPARRKLPPVVMSSRRLTVRAVVRCLLPSPPLSLYLALSYEEHKRQPRNAHLKRRVQLEARDTQTQSRRCVPPPRVVVVSPAAHFRPHRRVLSTSHYGKKKKKEERRATSPKLTRD